MGYTNPAFILIVYTPAIVAVVLVARHFGIRGLGRFFRRLTLWRMPAIWWLLLLVGIPAVSYAGASVKGTLGDPFPFSPWYSVIPALIPALLIGPIEEFGWRGVALPLLFVGVVWAVWHMPAFFLSGTKQSAWAFWPFFVGVIAVSVILTAMFNASRGSLFVAVLFHAQINGPAWPDAQPWDMYLFVVVAIVVVLVNRKAMLSRDGAATAVLINGDEPITDFPPITVSKIGRLIAASSGGIATQTSRPPGRSERYAWSNDSGDAASATASAMSTPVTNAPPIRAYCSARCPNPPIPKIATVSAGATRATLIAW